MNIRSEKASAVDLEQQDQEKRLRLLSFDDARHVIQRVGFAESPVQVARIASQSRRQVIAELLSSNEPIAHIPAPEWVGDLSQVFPDTRQLNKVSADSARSRFRQKQRCQIDELKAWWLCSLIETRNPLGARITLFWQNHFTSQFLSVGVARLMYQQHQTLMLYALGNFSDLLIAILRDPAMLIYLDNRVNRRQHPNENLARELLELFVLGEGNYSERDIRNLARALTGLSVNRNLEFRFKRSHHDSDMKELLGHDGALALEDVASILLQQPAAARFIAGKILKTLVSSKPTSSLLEESADSYRNSNYNMKTLLGTILISDEFWNKKYRGQLVKSPIELIVGTHRILQLPPIDSKSLIYAARSMKQDIYEPPNVRGWIGSTAWINSHTLLARRQFINLMLRDDKLDLISVQANLSETQLRNSILSVAPQQKNAKRKSLIHGLLRSAEYNVY